MTWAEFKQAVEAAGVKDADLLGWIDYVAPGTVRVNSLRIRNKPSDPVRVEWIIGYVEDPRRPR